MKERKSYHIALSKTPYYQFFECKDKNFSP